MTTVTDTRPPQAKKKLHLGVTICLVIMGLVLLLVAAWLIWRIQLGSQISTRLSVIRKAGEPANARELDAFYPTVPDEENAALVWMKGLEKLNPPYQRDAASPWGKIKLPRRGAKLGDLTLAAEVVNANEEALKLFRTAGGMKRSRYAVELSRGAFSEFQHLSPLKSISSLLRLEAEVAAENGKAEEASRALLTMLGEADSLKQEPILLSQLVRWSMHAAACFSAESAFNLLAFQESQLLRLQNAFEEAEDKDSLYQALLGERASGVTFLLQPEDLKAPMASATPESDTQTAELLKSAGSPLVRATGFYQRDGRFFMGAMGTNIANVRLPDPARFKSRNKFDDMALRGRKGYYVMSSFLLPALSKSVARDVENRARLRVAQTAMAVERYRVANGKIPGALEELVPRFLQLVPIDPIDGEPLRFKVLPRGYVVYSIGADEQDDDGTPKPTGTKQQPTETFDVTFTVERGANGR